MRKSFTGRSVLSLVVGVAVLAVAAAAGGCSSSDGAVSAQPRRLLVDRFDGQRAWGLVREQLAFGQRPAGSDQLRRLAVRLRRLLPRGHFEAVPGQPGLRNVVGTLPGRRPGIVVGAHYDTLADPPGFVGANNGAAGTAAVVEAARVLAAMPRPGRAREVRFVLFDGEEPPRGLPEQTTDFFHSGLRGSRAYVAAHPRRTREMLLLDYIANKGLRLPREANSSRGLWERVRRAARAVGAQRIFPPEVGSTIIDDHTPFLRAGASAVDFIDWSYPGHEVSDRLDKLSPANLDAVGETVVATVQALR
jgi:glutaminyl-peptide cyclotransferase